MCIHTQIQSGDYGHSSQESQGKLESIKQHLSNSHQLLGSCSEKLGLTHGLLKKVSQQFSFLGKK